MRGNRTIVFFASVLFTVMFSLPAPASGWMQDNQPATISTSVYSARAPAAVTAEGTIKEQGFTSYMYGTHVLVDSNRKTLYALRSESIDLDLYVGKKVTVTGVPVAGYPVDNGPVYLNVSSVGD
jgi:hypothetical protein